MSDHFSRPFSYDMIKDMINGMTFLSMRALHAFEIGKADLTGMPFGIGKADRTGMPFGIGKADHTGIPFEREVRLG